MRDKIDNYTYASVCQFTKTNFLIDSDFRLQHYLLKIRNELRLKTSTPLQKPMPPRSCHALLFPSTIHTFCKKLMFNGGFLLVTLPSNR